MTLYYVWLDAGCHLACHLLPVLMRCCRCPYPHLSNGLIWSLSSNFSCSPEEALLCLFCLLAGGMLEQLLPAHESSSWASLPNSMLTDHHVGSLKSDTVGLFTPQKSANPIIGLFPLESRLLNIYRHTSVDLSFFL